MTSGRYNIKDRVITKKTHPCGSKEWEIIRTGADFKLKCMGCNRIVMLSYQEFLKAVKKHKAVGGEQND